MDENLRRLIDQVVDQTISREDFERLQDALERDKEVREVYLRMVGLCESLSEIAAESSPDSFSTEATSLVPSNKKTSLWKPVQITAWQYSTAIAVLFLVGLGAFWLGRQNQATFPEVTTLQQYSSNELPESRIAGHATLRRIVELKWSNDANRHLEGDVLPNGILAFDSGVAEIDFFCGATLIVEGPARLEIESDWSVSVNEGRLRASVPPAARGFVVKAADSEIIDLGTEFALEVGIEKARVEVIDGEVEIRGGEHDGRHLLTGEGASLKGELSDTVAIKGLSTKTELDQQRGVNESRRFQEWLTTSRRLRSDDRLIAYFPIVQGVSDRTVPDVASSDSRSDGLMTGPVELAKGRFGQSSHGVGFDRTGARVRTRIDGEFQAFTFTCWARIDSLDHRYNALFMADGYENGEPHWQIRDDGSLMFSVMVDDSQEIEHFSQIDQKLVKQAGLHRVYYTKPFWDISRSGQWFHLAAVYDPASRRVTQYVNGEQVASETIEDKFFISDLHIGSGEIGNWGQPFRKTPWFSVRNLNGIIDELAIFNAALDAVEINKLYEQGKPLGY